MKVCFIKLQCYSLSESGVTDFQKLVLPVFRIRYYRFSESGITGFQNLVLRTFRIRCYRLSFLGCRLQTYSVL